MIRSMVRGECPALRQRGERRASNKRFPELPLDDLVVLAGGKTPDPIPNSAVKTPSAYGTASQDAGESVTARSSKRRSQKLTTKHSHAMHRLPAWASIMPTPINLSRGGAAR